jgi:hypothetical protein
MIEKAALEYFTLKLEEKEYAPKLESRLFARKCELLEKSYSMERVSFDTLVTVVNVDIIDDYDKLVFFKILGDLAREEL